ncbi:type IIL restriction-modification enzyme MmeI [Corynebacterium urealyticum]|uniref:type IIL restriction-modification enzyme MmeI n=1 Tax=Corynebacterium urealyticum TaxID=43771 RepID=UPI002E28B07F|nr:type IIL restriction-modification enzyme MmeI [Corynebacterium urealyticum]
MPRVVSESRRYFAVQHLEPEVIAREKVYTAVDPQGLFFGLVSSSMFITWLRAVGGRLKSDLIFSNTLVWNTFPVPELTERQRETIIKAGQRVLDARALHPERSLADHYNPLAMDPVLLRAHDALDREVDRAFGAPRKLTTERQRQELLFESYARMTYKK